MRDWKVIVGVPDGQLDAGESVRARLLDGWNAKRRVEAIVTELSNLDAESAAEDADALVVLIDGAPATSNVTPILGAMEDAGRPILALTGEALPPRNPYDFAGALVVASDRPADLLASELHALLHRQPHLDRLRRELAIAQRCHGGVEGEIARIHDELQLAAMVQREFLPRELPPVHEIEFAALWRPAHYVSGDIYDVVRLDDDHVGLFVADAVGHGVPAALMTMVICRSLATALRACGPGVPDPSQLLALINEDMIRRQAQTTRFATAVFAVVDCRARRMTLASAGHPPSLLFRADGSTHELRPEGGLLGIFEGETFESLTLDLAVDDCLLLHSDGFEQAFPETNSNNAFEARLPTDHYRTEFEHLARDLAPTEIIESVSRRLDDHHGSLHQVDDLTLVCMRVGALVGAACT